MSSEPKVTLRETAAQSKAKMKSKETKSLKIKKKDKMRKSLALSLDSTTIAAASALSPKKKDTTPRQKASKDHISSEERKKHFKTMKHMIFSNVQLVATQEFKGTQPEELYFDVGEIICFLERDDNGWVRGSTEDNRTGWFPQSKVRCFGKNNPFETKTDRETTENRLNTFLKERPTWQELGDRNVIQLRESQTAAKPDIIDKKKRKDMLTRFLQKVQFKEKSLFGKPISALVADPTQPQIPLIVEQCIKYLKEKEAHKIEGIFRISGGNTETAKLKDQFTSPRAEVNMAQYGPHCVAALLKQFFMALSDPLIPFSHYDTWVSRFENADTDEQKVEKLSVLIQQLPIVNRAVLDYLIEYLVTINANAKENLMASANLGVVFGPNLIRPRVPDAISLMSSTNSRIVEFMIENHCVLFKNG